MQQASTTCRVCSPPLPPLSASAGSLMSCDLLERALIRAVVRASPQFHLYIYVFFSSPDCKLPCDALLLAYEAFSYYCMRPSATSVWGLKLLVYEVFSYHCVGP